MRRYLVCLIFCFAFTKAFSQAQFTAGFAGSQVRQSSLMGTMHPKTSVTLGFNYAFHQIMDQKLSFMVGAHIAGKGYIQRIKEDNYPLAREIDYTNHFLYVSYPIGLSYRVFPFATLQAGMSPNLALYAWQSTGDNVFRLARDFRRYEVAGLARLSFLDNHLFGFSLAYQHSLHPLLNYHRIDEKGNFTGSIKDVYLQFFQLGVNLNLNDK